MLANLCHPGGEGSPVLSQLDGLYRCAENPDSVASQHACLGQLHAAVQSSLASKSEQHTIWTLVTDHLSRWAGTTGIETLGQGTPKQPRSRLRGHRLPSHTEAPPSPSPSYLGHVVRCDGEEVHLVSQPLGGLDCGDIGVDEQSLNVFFLQGLDGLGDENGISA